MDIVQSVHLDQRPLALDQDTARCFSVGLMQLKPNTICRINL